MPDWLDFDRFADWVSGRVVELPRRSSRSRSIDAFFPLVPSETLVVIGGNLASLGRPALSCSWSSPARRARSRRQHLVLDRPLRRGADGQARLPAARSAHRRLDWAERTLDERGAYIILIARFIPGGRTAVTFSAGYVHDVPLAALHRLRRRRRRACGRRTRRCSATSAARRSRTTRVWALALALGIALTLGFVVEVVRHFRQRRSEPRRVVSSAPPEEPGSSRRSEARSLRQPAGGDVQARQAMEIAMTNTIGTECCVERMQGRVVAAHVAASGEERLNRPDHGERERPEGRRASSATRRRARRGT